MSNLKDKLKLGATGAFPRRKLNQYGEGELTMGVSIDKNTVRLDFGKPVLWFAMGPNDAKALASLLLKHAENCEAEKPN